MTRSLILLTGLFGCTAPPSANAPVSAPIGEPLPGLTASELARFEAGRLVFAHPYSEAEGLGPRFNENACNACHTFPTDGGTGETFVVKATRVRADDSCDLLSVAGGENLRLQVTPGARAVGAAPVRSLDVATERARFSVPFTYGLGIIDAIPISTLRALADPDDLDGDGISGRIGRDASGAEARFGRKADVASLVDFTDGAFRLEMGLTTATVPDELHAGGTPAVPDGADGVPEPEIDAQTAASVVDFLRFLAPPAPQEPTDDPSTDTQQGRALFDSLGCTGCHVPELQAGPDDSPSIAHQAIALYSDLLLHDMGPALSGTCAPGATPTEYRTEPLMGLRYRDVYLHDGRTTRIMDAILSHGGEAQQARDEFAALDRVTQEAVLRFLGSL